jgi:carboxyl-terminal processing protease
MLTSLTARLFTVLLLLSTVLAAQTPNALLEGTLEVLRQNYVNPLNVNAASLERDVQSALNAKCSADCDPGDAERAIATGLNAVGDVHLRLLPAQSRATDDPGLVGESGHAMRLGIRTVSSGTALYVTHVQEGSSAAQKGVRVGDKITRAGSSQNTTQLEALLARAEIEGKSIAVTVRDGQGRERTILLESTRAPWKVTLEVRSDGVAVLRVPSISASNQDAEAIHAAVHRALEAKATKLVLDLRHAEGGTPFATASAAGAFLERVPLTLVNKAGVRWTYLFQNGDSALERSDQPGKRETDQLAKPALWKGPLVIVVSERTVSAGENLALLLQNAGRTKVVGSPTRGGAGVGANLFNLLSGARLLVATHLHLTPDGKRYPTRVSPDLEVAADLEALGKGQDVVLEAAVKLSGN